MLSSEIILETHDVIFAEIGACLNLDKNEDDVTNVLDAVGHTRRYVDGLTFGNENLPAVECDTRPSAYSHPVLRAVRVALIAQAFSRQYLDAFDLVRGGFVQDRESPPGSAVESR